MTDTTTRDPFAGIETIARSDDPQIPASATHIIIHEPDEGAPELLATAQSKDEATVLAAELAETAGGGEVSVRTIAEGKKILRQNEEATKPARELEVEDDQPDDDEKPAEPTQPDPAGEALFDRSRFETEALALPKADDLGVDKIAVAFTGRVLLDRSDENDVALYRKLRLGKDVELRVSGRVKAKSSGFTTNREGDLDAVVAEAKIDVGTVWVLDPEGL